MQLYTKVRNKQPIVWNKRNVTLLVSKSKSMPTLTTIIYTTNMIAPDEEVSVPAAPSGLTIISFKVTLRMYQQHTL